MIRTQRKIGPAPPPPPGGFTLLELLVVLSLLSAAVMLSIPSVVRLSAVEGIEADARSLLVSIRASHWRAVTSGTRYRVAASPGGYVIERREGGDWRPAGAARILSPRVTLRATGSWAKTLNPDGTCSTGSYILEEPGGLTRRLSLQPATGRVRYYRQGREAERGR